MMTPLSLVWIAASLGSTALASGEVVATPVAAQARLAEALADADSVDAVTSRDSTVTFSLGHKGEAYEMDVSIGLRGQVEGVVIRDVGHESAQEARTVGALTWLVREMRDADSVPALTIDGDDGSITLSTDDGRDYLVIPDRGDGNTSVEARWGAEWNNDRG